MKDHFIETLHELNDSRPKVNLSLIKVKEKEIEKTEAEVNQLVTIMTTNSTASRLESLIKKLDDSEKKLVVLKDETETLKQKLMGDQDKAVDLNYLLDGLDMLRSERFRKANLAKKREILRNLIKTIHVHPENVIMVDFWGSERQSEALRESHKGQSGVVLPFRKLGRPLEASFIGVDGGERMAEIKKAAGIGVYLGGFLMDDGSSSIRFGGEGEEHPTHQFYKSKKCFHYVSLQDWKSNTFPCSKLESCRMKSSVIPLRDTPDNRT
jgi:hypothetical protein